jgi:hypothetical protein
LGTQGAGAFAILLSPERPNWPRSIAHHAGSKKRPSSVSAGDRPGRGKLANIWQIFFLGLPRIEHCEHLQGGLDTQKTRAAPECSSTWRAEQEQTTAGGDDGFPKFRCSAIIARATSPPMSCAMIRYSFFSPFS